MTPTTASALESVKREDPIPPSKGGLIAWLFVLAYACNVLSVTALFHSEDTTYLYWSKHLSITILAICILSLGASKALRAKELRLAAVTCIALTPYLSTGAMGVAMYVDALVVVFAGIALGNTVRSGSLLSVRWSCLCIGLVPALVDICGEQGAFLYNTYYGRARLLLGYWHPKEAGVAVLITLLLYKATTKRLISYLDLVAVPLLWVIQSRNALMFYLSYILITFLLRQFGAAVMGVVLTIIYLLVPIVAFATLGQSLDGLMSGRMAYWLVAEQSMNVNAALDPAAIASGSAVWHIDNFFIEYGLEVGIIPCAVLCIALLWIAVRLGSDRIGNVYKNAIFLPFLIYSFFDSGFGSTGNLLNVVVFGFIFAPCGKVEGKETLRPRQRAMWFASRETRYA